ncbi:MAG: hypothetical protein AB1813_18930 [Verrucomicrobiota bacterium]|jgi:Tfp pilus assembly protein PilV
MRISVSKSCGRRRALGFTLEEVMVSIMITGLGLSGVVSGYLLAAERTEWASCSMAAQNLAVQRLEETRAARWDTQADPPLDELTAANFPEVVLPFDLPTVGTNTANGTVITTITPLASNPKIKLVRVDCVWTCRNRGPFTNSVVSLRSANQ